MSSTSRHVLKKKTSSKVTYLKQNKNGSSIANKF